MTLKLSREIAFGTAAPCHRSSTNSSSALERVRLHARRPFSFVPAPRRTVVQRFPRNLGLNRSGWTLEDKPQRIESQAGLIDRRLGALKLLLRQRDFLGPDMIVDFL